MERRTELIDGSIRTRSLGDREMMSGFRRTSREVLASTSGLLCRSTTWDEKFSKLSAAVMVDRTAAR